MKKFLFLVVLLVVGGFAGVGAMQTYAEHRNDSVTVQSPVVLEHGRGSIFH